jgi:1-aminocyclopropane-1-carboxylate deaminase/D-cysteine desulfhydrase-like pyridoxal-dependent ACC family enzyme
MASAPASVQVDRRASRRVRRSHPAVRRTTIEAADPRQRGALADPAAAVRRLAAEVAALCGLPIPSGEPRLLRGHVGAGYGAPTDDCRTAIRLVARTAGPLLDPVYSGKAFAGLMGLEPAGLDARTIVFLATGGAPALSLSRYEEWLADPAC